MVEALVSGARKCEHWSNLPPVILKKLTLTTRAKSNSRGNEAIVCQTEIKQLINKQAILYNQSFQQSVSFLNITYSVFLKHLTL